MGILTDFVMADVSEANAVASAVDRGKWPTVSSGRLTTLEVARLHFVMTGEDPDAPASPPQTVRNPFTKAEVPVTIFMQYMSTFTTLVDGGEFWVHQLPASLVGEIAQASDLPSIAERWAACDEMEGAEAGYLSDLLSQLRDLARRAQSSEKALLLWFSL